MAVVPGQLDEGPVRFRRHIDRFLRAVAMQGPNVGRTDRQNALRRQPTHVADIGHLQRGFSGSSSSNCERRDDFPR